MVGYVQQRIADALADELRDYDPELARRASKAWNTLLIVILELLARAYRSEPEREVFGAPEEVDREAMLQLSVETYERALRIAREIEIREFFVAPAEEIPDGSRKIIVADELSIGIFHHKGNWYALHNSCLHRGGPVCEGTLEGDVLTCPWHGYQYDVTTGILLLDQETRLPGYEVDIRDGNVYVRLACLVRDPLTIELDSFPAPGEATPGVTLQPPVALSANEFLTSALKPGAIAQVKVDGTPVAVANLEGSYYAVQDECTHMGGPLHQGHLEGTDIVCPWHDSCFDLRSGEATCGPATEPVRRYGVAIEGEKGVVSTAG
jgi:nitrite reductase/ring-hydroxylating ferredoxin subunit